MNNNNNNKNIQIDAEWRVEWFRDATSDRSAAKPLGAALRVTCVAKILILAVQLADTVFAPISCLSDP